MGTNNKYNLFYQNLEKACDFIKYTRKFGDLYDDIKQELAIWLWINPHCTDLKGFAKHIANHVIYREYKHHVNRFEPKNENDEYLLEYYYFVDHETEEQYGIRKSPVTAEQKEKISNIVQCNLLLKSIRSQKKWNKFNKSIKSLTNKHKNILNFRTYLPKISKISF